MYKTQDGDLTCEFCTREQCDGEIPDGAAWVDGGECYLCARTTPEQGAVDRVHCPQCHDDPAGCAECPHCPNCGDPMRDHDNAYCAEQNQGVL